MSPLKAIVRADGGRVWGVGTGHVTRTLALLDCLAGRFNLEAHWLMRPYADGVAMVYRARWPVTELPAAADERAEVEAALRLAKRTGARLAVINLRRMPEACTIALVQSGLVVVAIDDFGRQPMSAHLVVNGSLVADFLRYPSLAPWTRLLLGPRYLILAASFEAGTVNPLRPRCERILVSMGGADPTNLTGRVVRALAAVDTAAEVTVVLGPAYGATDRLGVALPSGRFTIVRDVADLAPLMVASDLAVAAGGNTAYELAATGTPGILVPSIEHEQRVADALVATGSAVALDPPASDFSSTLAAAVTRLAADPGARTKMGCRGRAVVDGQGRRRVTDAIAAALAQHDVEAGVVVGQTMEQTS